MREIKDVESSVDVVPELEIGVDTVYLRTNVMEFEREGVILKKYDEIQMTKDEYISKLSGESQEITGVVGDLIQILVDKGVVS